MIAAPAIVAHGGSEGLRESMGLLAAAAQEGWKGLIDGYALQAAIRVVVALEDCGAFNAGAGADVRLDGRRLEMDASVMDSRGVLGAIAGLTRTRNPVLAALEVTKTPHCLLAGSGGDRFAELMGLAQDAKPGQRALKAHRLLLEEIASCPKGQASVGYSNDQFVRLWNYPTDWNDMVRKHGSGTVGCVARDSAGGFAVATSTGGSAPCLWGRVGDSPIVGSGFYAGALGAIGCTGVGEFIVRKMLAREVYFWLDQGIALQEALDRGVALFPHDVSIGLIGVTASECGFASNRDMPVVVITT